MKLLSIAFIATLTWALPVAASATEFPVPPSLAPQVNFWVNVFSRYGKRQIVIHDTERLDRIYSVLDMSDLDAEGMTETQIELAMKAAEDDEKARIRALLRRLDQVDPRSDYLSDDERRLLALFADDPSPSKFADAPRRIGCADNAGCGSASPARLQIAHAYFPAMERIFEQEGVPPEITRLPMVESLLQRARVLEGRCRRRVAVHAGTARNFMRIDGVVDERLDRSLPPAPRPASCGRTTSCFGTWPLAIKAYNHGPAGIARAVRETGTTDAATIIENYHGPATSLPRATSIRSSWRRCTSTITIALTSATSRSIHRSRPTRYFSPSRRRS